MGDSPIVSLFQRLNLTGLVKCIPKSPSSHRVQTKLICHHHVKVERTNVHDFLIGFAFPQNITDLTLASSLLPSRVSASASILRLTFRLSFWFEACRHAGPRKANAH
jgi:hypothetical protein